MVAEVTLVDVAVAITVRAVTIHTKASSYKYRDKQHGLAERDRLRNDACT